MDSTKALEIIYKALDDKFAQDIVILDIREISVLADYFVIAGGNNPNQINAMASEAIEKLYKAGMNLTHSEGTQTGNWVVLDFSDIIVHIFDKDTRGFYNLERIWGDAKRISLPLQLT